MLDVIRYCTVTRQMLVRIWSRVVEMLDGHHIPPPGRRIRPRVLGIVQLIQLLARSARRVCIGPIVSAAHLV